MLRRIEVHGVRACMMPWEQAETLVHTKRGGSRVTTIYFHVSASCQCRGHLQFYFNNACTYQVKEFAKICLVRGLSPNGLLPPWASVLGPGAAKLFIFSFRVGSVLRNTNTSEKAPAAMSHS